MEDPYLLALIFCAVFTIIFAIIRLFVLEESVWKHLFTVLFICSIIGGSFCIAMIQDNNSARANPNGDRCEQRIDELKILAKKAEITVINSSNQPIRYIEVSSVYFKNSILELPAKRGYRIRLPYGDDEQTPKITVKYNEKEIVLDLKSCNPSFGIMPIDTDP